MMSLNDYLSQYSPWGLVVTCSRTGSWSRVDETPTILRYESPGVSESTRLTKFLSSDMVPLDPQIR